jgi:putative aldouronate transport system substrate-binding protein
MYPPLAGPAGAHHQQKNRTGGGIIFPIGVSKRPDFEKVIRAVDAMFFSGEAALLWCLGVEGNTYTMQGNTIKYADSILSAPDGIYKSMQLRYDCGSASTQFVWVNAREMTKYDLKLR